VYQQDLHHIDKGLLVPVEQKKAYDQQNDRRGDAGQKHLRRGPADPVERGAEGLDGRADGIEVHEPGEVRVARLELRERIHDRGRVHPQRKPEAHKLPQVAVLGRQGRDDHADAHAQSRELGDDEGQAEGPPGGPHRRAGRDKVHIERHQCRELDGHGDEVRKHLADRHGQAREVHLGKEPRVADKDVRTAREAGGEIIP